MGNIKNFNFDKIKLQLSNNDYWDFYLANDETSGNCEPLSSGSCFVVWYDFNNNNVYSGDSIYSLVSWSGAVNSGVTTNNFGLTGIDNGRILFDKNPDDLTNENLVNALTGTTLIIPSGETRLVLHKVSGTTSDCTYDIELLEDNGYFYSNFCGGFYQGFFKLEGYDYEVLPLRVNQSWSAEFWIKPQNVCSNNKTLNDLRPENKGYFFYLGSRSENKFWNEFVGMSTGCTSGCTTNECYSGETVNYWCTIPKENGFGILDVDSDFMVPLSPPRVNISLVTNEFLIYGRGGRGGRCCGPMDGLGRETVSSYDKKGIYVITEKENKTNFQNPFLVYGRGGRGGRCCGPMDGLGRETVRSFSGFSENEKEIDYSLDLINNSLGFRITDDGKISYKFLSSIDSDCNKNKLKIIEGISDKTIINNNEWNYLVIKFKTNYLSDCDLKTAKQRLGDYLIYVNGRLVETFKNIPEIMFKPIDDYKDKQLGVPYNISIGGGSQGLFESQTFDGLDMEDRNLIIEENFSGTFFGGISDFKFNICDLKFCTIKENYLLNKEKYNLIDEYLIDE